MFRSAN